MGFFDGGDTASETTNQNTQQTVTPQLTNADYGTTINISPFSGLNFNESLVDATKGSLSVGSGAAGRAQVGTSKGGSPKILYPAGGAGGAGGGATGGAAGGGGSPVGADAGLSGFDAGFSLDLSVESLTPEAAALFSSAQEVTRDALGGLSQLVDYGRDVFDAALASNEASTARALDFVQGFSEGAADAFTRGGSLGAAAAQGSPVVVPAGGIDPKLLVLVVGTLAALALWKG